MPLYDFECLRCGHTFEQQTRVADLNPPCPKVGEDEATCDGFTQRLISGGSFQLLGSGWAKDGYS